MAREFRNFKSFKGKYAVEMKNVFTRYHGELKPAIIDINFKVEYGDFVLVTGPNGAGKTTLLETIIGLLKPYRGEVKLLGFNIPKEAYLARKYCAYLPQDFMKSADEPFLVKDVIIMGLASKIISNTIPKEIEKDIDNIMRLLKIEELKEKPIGKLSGGQQQKVHLARVLIRKPLLMLLDEPFSSLDRNSRFELSEILTKINEEQRVTIIMVSHDLSIIPKGCNRVVEMNNGRIIGERKL